MLYFNIVTEPIDLDSPIGSKRLFVDYFVPVESRAMSPLAHPMLRL